MANASDMCGPMDGVIVIHAPCAAKGMEKFEHSNDGVLMAAKQERMNRILATLEARHFVNMGELARAFGVSEMTVRRDAKELAERRLVRLVYGGMASPCADEHGATYVMQAEQSVHTREKQKIARLARAYLQPGDVLFLDSGTTIQQLAEILPTDAEYTVICCSLNTLNVVTRFANCTVIAPGGVFSPRSLVFSGSDAVNLIRRYRAGKAFFGATGYALKHGLTCGYVEDAPLKRAIMDSSVDKILLMDSSKFGKVSTCSFADIGDFGTVITDANVAPEYARHIRAQGVERLIANADET